MLRKNCIFPDHAALVGSSPPGALIELIERLCGGDKTIVTPCPSPRALVLSGAISCPLLFALRSTPTILPASFVVASVLAGIDVELLVMIFYAFHFLA
jgi:hypothetical protein